MTETAAGYRAYREFAYAIQSAQRANFACGILGGGQMLAQNVVDSVNRKRIAGPTASSLDQAILDAYLGIQTPENVTQTRQATATDNAILQTLNQFQNPTANVPQNNTSAAGMLGNVQNNNTPASVNENVTQAEAESTAVNDNPATHTPQEQAVIEAYKNSVDDGLVEYYNKYKNQNEAKKVAPYVLKPVSDRAAADIAREIGVDVTGFATRLDAKQANHIYTDHGKKGGADLSMADPNDVGRMQYVLDNYDTVTNWGRTDAYSEPNNRGGTRTAKTVLFSKKVNGTYYVVEAAPNTKAKSLYVVSAYMLKDGKKPYGNAQKIKSGTLSQPSDTLQSRRNGLTASGISVPDYSTVASTAASVNTQNQVAQNFVQNDGEAPGAMRSQFESHPQQSQTQSNTIGKMESEWGVPYEQREPLMYDTISEAKSLDNARLRLAQDYEGEMSELQRKHNWSGEEVDMGMTILDNYRRAAEQTGDWSEYSEWRKTVSEHGTEAARALQAYAKYSRQTGGGIVADAAALLDGKLKKHANKDQILDQVSTLAERYDNAIGAGKQNAEVNVDELLTLIQDASKVRKTGTFTKNETPGEVEWAMNRIANYARAEAQGDGGTNLDFLKTFAANSIYNIAADYKPVTVGQVVKTIYRNNLLSKAATVLRNFVANNGFDPVDSVSRNIAVPLDILLSKFTGTRSVAADASWFSSAKRKGSLDGLARSVMQVGLDVDTTGNTGRYGATSNRTFKMNGGVVSRLLSMWEVESGYLLNSTDEFQKGGIEASVQAGIDQLYEQGKIKGRAQRDANGNIVRDSKTGNIKYTKDNSLRNAGEQEALYRTFQDETILSDLSTSVRKVMNKVSIDGETGLGDFVMPFAQVPSNLGARAIEYSPDGLAVAAFDFAKMLSSASKGEMTAAQQAKAVQGLGRAINGTALIAISTAMALRGHIRASGDDDDANKNALEKVLNLKGIQLNLSSTLRDITGRGNEWQDDDVILSLDFLEPLNAQLGTGAMIAEDLKEANKGLNLISFFKEGNAIVTALLGGIVGYALFKLGLG